MKIVKPSVEIYYHKPFMPHSKCPTNEPIIAQEFLERVGRTCYKSEDKITNDSASKFIRMLNELGHGAMLEHGVISVLFVCDRGCCFDNKTEVLTDKGWVLFKDIKKTDSLAGLNDSGELVYDKPIKLQKYKFKGKLLAFESTSIDLLVTPNHRMWVFDYDKRSKKTRTWKFLEADQLTNNRYKFSKKALWNAKDTQFVKVPAHRTLFNKFPELIFKGKNVSYLFELLGIWATDGCARDNRSSGHSLYISQRKKNVIDRIHFLCKKLYLKYYDDKDGVRIDNDRMLSFAIKLFGRMKPDRRIPNLIKNASSNQIRSFLDGVELGDGTKHKKNEHVCVYSGSYNWSGDLQELYLKSGLSANVRTVEPRVRKFPNGHISECKTSFVVSVHREKKSEHLLNKKTAKLFAVPVKYNDFVYCATVPTGRLYVRRNGKACWSGNSHELVRHRLASFAQESTRYVNYGKEKFGSEISVIKPFDLASAEEEDEWKDACLYAEAKYLKMLKLG